MKRTLHEIETELKKVKAEALADARSEHLNKFKEALENRYFSYKHDGQRGRYSRWMGYVHYSKFKLNSHSDDYQVEYIARRVYVCFPPGGKTLHYGNDCGVIRSVNPSETVEQLFEATRQHIEEIDKKTFNQVWEWPIIMAEKAWFNWPKNPDPQLTLVEETNQTVHVMDCPHVTLTPPEMGFLSGSPFILTNNRHLLTENAMEYVRSKVQEDLEREGSGAMHYEDCDRSYLDHKVQLRSDLMKKFCVEH